MGETSVVGRIVMVYGGTRAAEPLWLGVCLGFTTVTTQGPDGYTRMEPQVLVENPDGSIRLVSLSLIKFSQPQQVTPSGFDDTTGESMHTVGR
jgi:hypothetical protein